MAKYYCVREGRIPGIYTTWEECKAQVHEFTGAVYHKWSTKEQAEEYMKKRFDAFDKSLGVECYVDGSYCENNGYFGYSAVVVKNDKVLKKASSARKNSYAVHRNIAGELYGALLAIEIAIRLNEDYVTIYHDLENTANWALGVHDRTSDLTNQYYDCIQNYKRFIKINFVKVPGHSGVYYNEMADELAKEAAITANLNLSLQG